MDSGLELNMDIYILRHGDAEPGGKGLPDADRTLTSKGRRDVERVAGFARDAKLRPGAILTSPYQRAVETAAIAAKVLGGKPQPAETAALLPDARPERIWKELRSLDGVKQVLIAGHEPHLSRLAAYLLGAPALRLDLKKGALTRIRVDGLGAAPHGELKWVITPALVRGAKTPRP
jgi:phosphohistidine phosphatase